MNTRGTKGTNIPCDLHMEHLNRRLKTSMGSNVIPSRIQRAGESLAPVHRVCEAFEKQTANQVHTDKHLYPSFGKDFLKIIASLQEGEVFDYIIPGHNHPLLSLPRVSSLSIQRLNLSRKLSLQWSNQFRSVNLSTVSLNYKLQFMLHITVPYNIVTAHLSSISHS